jgi:hypothetical protein
MQVSGKVKMLGNSRSLDTYRTVRNRSNSTPATSAEPAIPDTGGWAKSLIVTSPQTGQQQRAAFA